jgi:putative transposase
MPRRPRQEMEGGVHHVFARGNRRQALFFEDDDRRLYLSGLEGVVEKCGWDCLSYCLMTNHTHLLIRTPKPNLGLGLGKLHSRKALTFNRRYGLETHLFHRPCGSKAARDDSTVRYWAIYLALNPVRAGLAPSPDAYLWSSYAATLGLTQPPGWLDADGLVAHFGSRDRYAGLVDSVRAIGAAGFDAVTVDTRQRVAASSRAGAALPDPEPRRRSTDCAAL